MVCKLKEGRERVMILPEKSMNLTSNLIIDGTQEDEVLIYLSLMKKDS